MSLEAWLLDSDPALRWQVLRDLTGASDGEVAAERARIATEGLGARLLALQATDGTWGGAAWNRGWDSTMHALTLLREFGLDPASGPARLAMDRIREDVTWRGAGPDEVADHRFFEGEVEPCINGQVAAAGAYFRQDVRGLVERLVTEQLADGGWNCEAERGATRSSFNTTICVLEALLEDEKAFGPSPPVNAARRRGEEYLLERRLFHRRSTGEVIERDRKGGTVFTAFAFPNWWHYDVLRALDYLRSAGVTPDQRVSDAIRLVESKRDADGTWKLETRHPGRRLVELDEGEGRPNRWITLRAMRVMNWFLTAVLTLLVLCGTTVFAQQPPGRTSLVSGTWLMAMPMGADTNVFRFTLRFDRDSIWGANTDGLPIQGRLRGDSVRFEVMGRRDGARVQFLGVAKDGVIRGIRAETPKGAIAPSQRGDFLARQDVPSRAPMLHSFSPQSFHRLFSGSIPPALVIVPGDTVRTWTVDAGGLDSTGQSRSRPGNPLTGPFYIDGALRGDMLVVRLHRVRLNRDFALAGDEIIGNALTADYYSALKGIPDFSGRWRLDRGKGMAMLDRPTAALANYAVPVRPMLGCIGVAPPAGQAFASGESGRFGGNMDYNEIREGVTVYLPVFQRGAMLFIGDGHALQGDGELTGDALETSMDVEFSVELVRWNSTFRGMIDQPRAENDQFLMSIGIHGDLTDALREATTDLSRWLETDYKLKSPELASVLGTSVRYDVADLVGSQVSIVAKFPKSALRQLSRPTPSGNQ